ncbi:MAG: hypothetical protein ACTSQV_03485 [Alphaproteobacteria bacterium]
MTEICWRSFASPTSSRRSNSARISSCGTAVRSSMALRNVSTGVDGNAISATGGWRAMR